jgi:hypothetical protein
VELLQTILIKDNQQGENMSDHYNRFGNDEHQGRNQQYQGYDRNRGYDHHDGYDRGHGYGHDSHYLMYLDWAKRIFQNKTWLMLALILLFFAVAVGIWLLSLLMPFLGQLLSVAEKNGIKGAVEAISPYLLKLWEGAGK